MGLLSFLLLGLIAGVIARALVPGKIGSGLIPALICGVAGAMLGGWLSTRIFHISLGNFFDLRTWVIAVAGSALVLVVWGVLFGKKN